MKRRGMRDSVCGDPQWPGPNIPGGPIAGIVNPAPPNARILLRAIQATCCPTRYSGDCAKDAVKYVKNKVYCDRVKNFNTLVQKFDPDSLAYSYDIGHYHFVQLNNYPTYIANSINIKSAIGWRFP